MIATIQCDDNEGCQINYCIEIEKVDKCKKADAKGQYYPIRHTGAKFPKIELSKLANDFTLEHECLHATIDFVRTIQKVSFDDLFTISNPFGEEAFIYYYEDILKECRKALND